MNITLEGDILWGMNKTVRQWLNLNLKYERIKFNDILEIYKSVNPDKRYTELTPVERELIRRYTEQNNPVIYPNNDVTA